MCDCDLEQPSTFRTTDRKARKWHRCSECRCWIEPGETYLEIFGVWDGDARTYRRCIDCQDIIAWAEKQDDCLCLPIGEAFSAIMDSFHDAGLTHAYVEARERIREVRWRRKSLGISA